jgi:hypothetical protein
VEVSISPDDGVQAAELMEKANAAMYCARMRGGEDLLLSRGTGVNRNPSPGIALPLR